MATLRFTAVANKSYTIQYRDDASTGGWQRLADVPAAGASRSVDVPDPINSNIKERFYRLVTPAMR